MQHIATEVQMDVYWCQINFGNMLFQALTATNKIIEQDRRFKKKETRRKQKKSFCLASLRRAALLLHIIHTYFSQCAKMTTQTKKTSEPGRSKSLPNVYDVPE